MCLLTYDWKAKRELVEYVDLPTPKDSMLLEPDLVIRHCSKVGGASA